MEREKQHSKRKRIWNAVFLAVVFLATLWSVFKGEDISQVMDSLKTADKRYLVPGCICVLAFILGESVVICYLMRRLGAKIRFSRCCLYSFIGFFYSCITPSASGGQPMQVVAMRKDRIPVAVSSVVLAIVTITYKLVLVIIGVTVLLIHPASVMRYLDPVRGIILLGLVLNIICITALLLLVFSPSAVYSILMKVFAVINKIRPMKFPEKQHRRLEGIIGQYKGTAMFYRMHKKVIAEVFLITFLQRCCLFLVTWFVYCSFGLSGHSLPLILTLQAMISVAADMLPLPGGMGVSENLFLEIFLPVFGDALILPGMMLSRGLGYYTQLLVSAVMTVAASFIICDKKS